jgi:glycosyltransferase involved in cell wall biosynthesis
MTGVLMVAFHYPPCSGTSGVHRTLSFSRYLPREGWRPIVLSAESRAYESKDGGRLSEIPDEAIVCRVFALDARRHLSVRGRYLRATALPDRWITWWLGAVPAGLRLIRVQRPRVIWSTYPIATAHLIALTLHRLTGLPWVADFRDPMTDVDYPHGASERRLYAWLERQAVRYASRLVFTTEGTRRLYLDRYPALEPARAVVIPNGYEESDFQALPAARTAAASPFRLVHSGTIYPEERDPLPMLRALARLNREGVLTPAELRVELRAPGHEKQYASVIQDLGLAGVVRILPAIPHRQALLDCADASALLLLQGPSCNAQIPAKTYEYLRLGRPILTLTPAASDTAAVLAECGGATRVEPLDEDAIHAAFPAFVRAVQAGRHPLPDAKATARYARHTHAAQLAACFTEVMPALVGHGEPASGGSDRVRSPRGR